MNTSNNAALTLSWLNLWNGDLGLADRIVAEDFLIHAALMTGTGVEEMHGRGALKQWIGGIRALFPDLAFAFQVGPIADKNHLVARWQARGTYGGGFPGASPKAVGRHITFSGTDILRVTDGMLVEYWVNSDALLLLQQLGVKEVPGGTG